MLQIRPAGGGPAYAPNRDIAHVFIPACSAALYTLLDEPYGGWFKGFLEAANVTEEEMGKAARAFAFFCSKMTDPGYQSSGAALQASGFYDLPAAAQAAFYSRLGVVMTGLAWGAVRDAHHAHAQPASLKELLEQAEAYSSGGEQIPCPVPCPTTVCPPG